MKQKLFYKLLFFLFFSITIYSQSRGDIAFTAINVDGDDDFAIVVLNDISANTTIYFTDYEWDEGTTSFIETGTDGFLNWNTGGSVIEAGTVVVFTDVDNSSNTNYGVSVGSLTSPENVTLIASGETFFAYLGSDKDTPTLFLTGIKNGSITTDLTGTGLGGTDLQVGVDFLEFNPTVSPDGGIYSGSRINQSSFANYFSLIVDKNNWTRNTDDGEALLPFSSVSFIESNIWSGSNDSTWNDSGNWSSGIPTSSSNVYISNSVTNYPTVTTAETINSLYIESNASLVATNAGFTVTNDATYFKNLANSSQWYFISSPVVGESYDATWVSTNSVASGSGDNRGISTYDNSTNDGTTGHWRYLQSDDSNSSTFNDSQGYGVILSSAGDVSFVGSGIYTADQSITITQGVNNFNLVGNPFTSYYKLGDLFTGNSSDISTTAWFWNGSSYTTRVSGINDTFNANYLITPGEGFFVSSLLASTTLNFTLSNANHEDSFSSGGKYANTITRVTLNVKENSNSREARIYYIEGTTTGYDNDYEGKLFGGASDSFEFYSHLVDNSSTEKYQIQSLPNTDYENMVVPVGLKATAGKEITFSAETLNIPNGLNVYLEDRATNTVTQLNEAKADYTITLTENIDGIGRFYLHTKASAVLSTDANILNSVSIFKTNSNTLRIAGLQQGNASVKLYNMLGKEVLTTSFQTTGVSDINLPNLSTGVYIVQLTTENGSINKKITLE